MTTPPTVEAPGSPAHAHRIAAALATLYPHAVCALHFSTPWQLLVATILSAQCTDERVNQVTPALFKRFPDAIHTARADLAELEALIRSTGFFHNKAKNIIGAAQAIVSQHGGEVPRTQEALVALPGVGRKTANVVLGNAFGVPGFTVDTHLGRLARRWGLTRHDDPVKVEFDLMALFPQPTGNHNWTTLSHRAILHGRALCMARKPACERCPLAPFCPRIGV